MPVNLLVCYYAAEEAVNRAHWRGLQSLAGLCLACGLGSGHLSGLDLASQLRWLVADSAPQVGPGACKDQTSLHFYQPQTKDASRVYQGYERNEQAPSLCCCTACFTTLVRSRGQYSR